jgi:acyl-CoA synthetase (AMP-forming)/AMP-acid ligase II
MIATNDDGKKFALLSALYDTNGRWSSLFAAFTPTEDFVETFELSVLANARSGHALVSLPLYYVVAGVVRSVGDIPRTSSGKHQKFKHKRNCFPLAEVARSTP